MHMVMHKNVPYIRCRDGIYYFVRCVPDDVKSNYLSNSISMCLRTKSNREAIRAIKSRCQLFDDFVKVQGKPKLSKISKTF